ncbi:hypothetical protein KJ654_02840 [Patescibacteria group bacterium]|nr:hypothetical protein [Patescibacteria group bacterium]MBU1967405.1 hypothetical protein [Patescibacteria group bacterium]
MTAQSLAHQVGSQDPSSYVDSYQPPTINRPASVPPTSVTPPTSITSPISPIPPTALAPKQDQGSESLQDPQSLQSQNIFFLLGVQDGSDEEKEVFLDELQQVIWEDFLENDVKLLITEAEMIKLQEIMAKGDGPEEQEGMTVYLEKLIPDLEEIMLEKAFELKQDLVKERTAGMREYYLGNDTALGQLDKAEQLIDQDQWLQAAELLNVIGK